MTLPLAVSIGERKALAAVAALLGRLLVREVDREFLGTLRLPGVAAALAGLDVVVPAGDPAVVLDALATAYYGTFLDAKRGVALVQSICVEGRYEGNAAVAVRQLALEAGLEHDVGAARGAPGDHLGAILLLWADLAVRWPPGAAASEDRHLRWATGPLETVAASGEFYGQVARATMAFVESLVSAARPD